MAEAEPLAQPMLFTAEGRFAEVAPAKVIAPYVPVYTPEALRNYHDMTVVRPEATMHEKAQAVYLDNLRNKKIAAGKMPKMLMPGYDVNGFRDAEIARERQNQLKQAKMDSTLLAAKAGVNAVEMVNEIEMATIVSANQLNQISWHNVTETTVTDLNRALQVADITTPTRIRHFMAQVAQETGRGESVVERHDGDPEVYFRSRHSYIFGGPMYRGAGYIQLSHDFHYISFATWLILQTYPELQEFAVYRNPSNTDTPTLRRGLDNLVRGAESLGLDVSRYTNIVDLGYQYVADYFPWTSAAYFWATNNLNAIVDRGGTVDEITDVVNPAEGSVRRGRRIEFYNDFEGIFD